MSDNCGMTALLPGLACLHEAAQRRDLQGTPAIQHGLTLQLDRIRQFPLLSAS